MTRSTISATFASFVLLSGCSYDWTVGTSSSGSDGGSTMPVSSTCAVLAQDIQTAYAAARKCTASCTTKAKDACGCDVTLGDLSAATGAYSNVVAKYSEMGCTMSSCSCFSFPNSGCVAGTCVP